MEALLYCDIFLSFLHSPMKKPLEQIPFHPARWPFFYGWMILFWSIIGTLLSVPGQTTGVSAFIDAQCHRLAGDPE